MALALLTLLPDSAHACPVCFDPRDENRFAFLATTIFLTLLPLGLVAGVLLWVRHRSRQLAESEPQAGTEVPPPELVTEAGR
jgi:hypothetical protein